jgi:dihydrofolate synthase/folylpolyglutamate synthase
MDTNPQRDPRPLPPLLAERVNYERTISVPYQSADFKLDRMRRLLRSLSDPHLAVKAIHIAGTKGKGSTAVMIAAVLEAAGLRTGLYTSPHLDRIEERIAVNGRSCPQDVFLSLAEQVRPAVEELDREAATCGDTGPTFFEVTTAMAFLHFAQQQADAAVLEVGLGGRLDSTNVCHPEVSVITSISFDHMRQLGNTLAAIAGEKAGIIKPHIPVVSGVLPPEPRDVIAAQASAARSPLFQRGPDFDIDPSASSALTYREPATGYELTDVHLAMVGDHQAANAAVAIATINRLRERDWSIPDEALRAGLQIARCPARIEQLATRPTTILDVAHNVASIEALLAALQRFPARRRILVFASSKDKDYAGMLERLLPAFNTVFLTQYVNNPRAMEAEGLLAIAQQIRRASNANNDSPPATLHAAVRPHDALRLARLVASPDDLICIAGSFFLAAELRPLI